ncbi:NADH:flavin oxidoreductase/NADH oxidase family protein [Granulosicoccus sp. 3-233]|uniref:NADH:flavin oxidoreductase/NADH oxidase family protein n=1 Tax=Granulosicoccus sp. 3-233 TaxID=3417969 RepID=UPI003D32FFA2
MTYPESNDVGDLFQPFELPCGVVLKNRIVKSAMSDSLGDGCGNPSDAQMRLYERWADGGVAASIIGEVQGTPHFAEKPGNLVLRQDADLPRFRELARRGAAGGTQLWLQLGHAGAMAHPPISTPKGPSAIDIPGLTCDALTLDEIRALPAEFARTASLAQDLGFGGVQIHAAHGFLLSQFLSPLFNKRDDAYGGSLSSRMQLLLEVVEAVRDAVDPGFVVAVKLNATDQLEEGFAEDESLEVVAALDGTGIDLIDISGGTYFPGAKSASDSAGSGPYFLHFAALARERTSKPLMATGGFKTRQQAVDALVSGHVDLTGIARGFVLDAALPKNWQSPDTVDPVFPRFSSTPVGGVTAWYTLQLTRIGEGREIAEMPDLEAVVRDYDERDRLRSDKWIKHFS